VNLDNSIGFEREKGKYTMLQASMSLSQYIDVWLTTFKRTAIKPSSYQRLVTSFKALEKYPISQKPVGEITFFDVQLYLNRLADDGYSLTTIQKQYRLLTAPLKQAAAMRIIQSDPTVGVNLPAPTNIKKQKKDIQAYTKEEQARLASVLDADGGIGAICIGFIIETGLRVGEALALRWKDVDVSRCRIRIGATVVNLMHKTNAYIQESPKSLSSVRIVPLTKHAIELLMKARTLSDTEWVFQSRGERLSYAALVYQTKKLCSLAMVPYYGEHALRHTFATNCYYKGMDVKILSKILGHSSTTVTYNTYINLYGDAFEDMYKAINA